MASINNRINNSRESNLVKGIVGGSVLCAMLFLQGCNASMKNRVLGRAWTNVSGHEVVIAPCYWPNTKSVENAGDASTETMRKFTCGNTEVAIKNEELFVNGKAHGTLHKGDAIAVENGRLRINLKEVEEVASK